MEKIGDKIYNLRKERGLSQEILADALCVTRNTVSRWERNEVVPTDENMKKFCEFLSVSLYTLIPELGVASVNRENTEAETNSVDTMVEQELVNKTKKPIKILSWVMFAILGAIMLTISVIICIVIGMKVFSPNKGDSVKSAVTFGDWQFYIGLLVAVVSVIGIVVFIIKFYKNRKK